MKPGIKVKVIWFVFFTLIYTVIASILFFISKETGPLTAGIIGFITTLLTTIIAPRSQKIKLQSGEKTIIKNDLFNLFKKEDS